MIRVATTDDIDQVMPLVKGFYDESIKLYGMPFNEKNTKDVIELFINDHIVLVACIDGHIGGVVAGVVSNWWLDLSVVTFQEIIWYVLPQNRGYRLGYDMLKRLEEFCYQAGVHKMCMANMSNLKDGFFHKFYTNRGYVLMESHYLKDVTSCLN